MTVTVIAYLPWRSRLTPWPLKGTSLMEKLFRPVMVFFFVMFAEQNSAVAVDCWNLT